MKIHTVKSEWSIVYIEGPQVIFFFVFLSLKMDFVLANSADPDEMWHHPTFHLGLGCVQKYSFRCF